MKNKKLLLQNLFLLFPFIQLFLINLFQIRRSEIYKLLVFAFLYLILFNIFRFLLKRFININNSEYFALILFYFSFNYSNITIFIYFEAFDFIKFIPNYSFILFVVLLVLMLVLSRNDSFNRLFEFSTLTYFVFLIIIGFNSTSLNSLSENSADNFEINEYNNIVLTKKPDMYFIIYDGLPSLSTMEKFYDYDTTNFKTLFNNNDLINYKLAASSYGRTTYTMSTLLNMNYIFKNGDIAFSERGNLSKSYREGDSLFENILRSNNYSLYKFGLAFNCNLVKNDNCITTDLDNYSEKDSVYYDLIMRTPLKILVEKGFLNINGVFSISCNESCSDPELDEVFKHIDNKTKPKAVFLHFMDTHGPYLLGKNCELLDEPIYDLPKTNINSYKESLDCAYLKISNLIKLLDLENDIVFIQSDHGPNYEKMELTNIEDLSINQVLNRYSTFSVSNLESQCKNENVNLNETVNTFIYFINCNSLTNIQLLEVKNYLAFGKINSLVFDVSDFVQKTITSNYK